MINNFSDKIFNVSNDTQINAGDHIFLGVVENADEVSNVCSVKFVSQYGDIIIQHFVPVSSDSNNGVIGWFPNIGDKVYIRMYNHSKYEIISLCTNDYSKKHRHTIDINCNILSSHYNYTMAGNIF